MQVQLTTDTVDLKMTEDTLPEDTVAIEDTMRDCQAKAVEFETATNGRSEELDACAKARAVISQKTGGAESFSFGLTQTSFLQLSRSMLTSCGGLTKFGAVREDQNLRRAHSLELVQFASRVASTMHAETFTIHTVEVERSRIIKQTVQKPIVQEKIPELQFTDKVVNIPVLAQFYTGIVQKTTDTPQLQCIDKVIDVFVGLVKQVSITGASYGGDSRDPTSAVD